MCARISIQFMKDAGKAPFWPCYVFQADKAMAIYVCILEHTDHLGLAADVVEWIDRANIGETYDCDELSALIIDD